jgi:hypothetical protein
MDIKNSLKIVSDNIKYFNEVKNFSKKKLLESVSGTKNVFIDYNGFEVISETQIRVHYTRSYGDMEDSDYITVDINNL